MVFYDNKILNPNLAPKWFTNVTVIEITPNPGVSGTDPFYGFLQTKYALLHGQTSERERQMIFTGVLSLVNYKLFGTETTQALPNPIVRPSDDTTKASLTIFWELYTVIFCAHKDFKGD